MNLPAPHPSIAEPVELTGSVSTSINVAAIFVADTELGPEPRRMGKVEDAMLARARPARIDDAELLRMRRSVRNLRKGG